MKRKTRKLIATVLVGAAALGVFVYNSFNGDDSAATSEVATQELPAPPPSPEVEADPRPEPATDEQTMPAYDRSYFGQRWKDVDRNGCDTRNDILGRDLTNIEYKPGTRGCVVLSGTLRDPYSGETIEFVRGEGTSELVPIDHLVAMRPAWEWGAWKWSIELREEFANDPINLVATTREANSSKSDLPPSKWLPSDPAGKCRFAGNFLTVVEKYQLDAPEHELAVLQSSLEQCPSYAQ